MTVLRAHYDVVIVGAGVGGGAMANRLTKAGATVLIVERGTRLPREADNWSVKAVFHDRKYSTRETWRDRNGQEYTPSTYCYVGGSSKFFGTATLRFREQDFLGMQHESGATPAWPIKYAGLAPYCDVAEALIGTHVARCGTWTIYLYVIDASFLPSSTAVNPSLTIVAQAVRTAEHLIETLLTTHRARQREIRLAQNLISSAGAPAVAGDTR